MTTTSRRKLAKTPRQDDRTAPLLPVQELLVELAIAMHATVAVRRLPKNSKSSASFSLKSAPVS